MAEAQGKRHIDSHYCAFLKNHMSSNEEPRKNTKPFCFIVGLIVAWMCLP